MNYNKGIYVKPAMCSYFKIPLWKEYQQCVKIDAKYS